ncbi:MAG: type II toxin-antitoxin system Phd/YefM family antitoxin [Alphaproteobacteria bacterium]
MTATDFKARCLEVFDQLSTRKLARVTITKRGRPVAVLIPPATAASDAIDRIHGAMRGSVVIPAGADLTKPALDEPLWAEDGMLDP